MLKKLAVFFWLSDKQVQVCNIKGNYENTPNISHDAWFQYNLMFIGSEHDLTVIQWITSYHSGMTTRYITLSTGICNVMTRSLQQCKFSWKQTYS